LEVARSLIHSRVLYIGPRKMLNDYYTLGPNTFKTAKIGQQGLMQPVASTRSSSTCLRHNLRDGATCTTLRRTSASLQPRLGNPSQTCFHTKQAARSRRMFRADLPLSVLLRNRQTEAHLVLRPKPRNCRGDFEAQITKPGLPVLRSKPENPPPPWF
jgi:hypothetical protein